MPNPPQPRPQAARPKAARPKAAPSRLPAPSTQNPQAPYAFELVDPRWILKALAAMLALALVFGYLTICIVFSRTQWELVLHPSRSVTTTPAALGLAFTEVHFADDAAGQPQLDGWWIPAASTSNPAAPASNPAVFTALLLHGSSGSISDALPQAATLHNAGLDVLLFDYRGFGHSAGHHPTAAFMQADADSAYTYLTATRGLPPNTLLAYGNGLGASLAIQLCAEHARIPALILESPDGDLEPRVRADVRSHLLPVGLLFHENFPLAAPIRTLATPKLLISFTRGGPSAALQHAANPKMLVELRSSTDTTAMQQAIRRFFDTYGPPSPPIISPPGKDE
jgi:pimeloyl-ACP methyl ester carboxylesterase